MADVHRQSVQESLNVDTSAGWSVKSAITAGTNAATTNTVHYTIGASASQLGVYSAGNIYFNFSTSTSSTDGDCSTTNDLVIPGNTTFFLKVPRGLGTTIYFNALSESSATKAVRIVEM